MEGEVKVCAKAKDHFLHEEYNVGAGKYAMKNILL